MFEKHGTTIFNGRRQARRRAASALRILALAAAAALVLPAGEPLAHGFAGARFFPATILTDDPFVADEVSIPTFTRPPLGPDGSQEYDLDFDLAKRITPDFGLTFGRGWTYLQPKGAPAVTGWGDLSTGAQYQLFINGDHEAMALAGVNVEWAHTGRVQALGAADFTTVSPTFDWGKGFGDLPDSLKYLKPFAITGNIGFDFPTKSQSAGAPNPDNFNYGFALEYPISYLQSQVKDLGLRFPWQQMIPLVEFAASTPIDRGGGPTIGTVQPGVIWAGTYFQIGAEMIVPINGQTGKGVGAVVQFHVYLDDALPNSLGKPIAEWFK